MDTVKVRMRTLAADPTGIYRPGEVVRVPRQKAEWWIDRGYAERVEAARPAKPEVELATAEPPEQAVKPSRRRRKKGG